MTGLIKERLKKNPVRSRTAITVIAIVVRLGGLKKINRILLVLY